MKGTTQKRKKIIARVGATDYARLEKIVKVYGFKSVYSLMQYIMFCFLRVADHDNDDISREMPIELINTFDVKGDAEAIYSAIARIRGRKKKSCKECELDMFDPRQDAISRDIQDIFNEAEEEGEEYSHNIRERRER